MRLIDADALVQEIISIRKDVAMAGWDDEYDRSFLQGENDGLIEAGNLVKQAPTIEPERKWETCFDCPLSHGCPKIQGCTNQQAVQYASEIPDDCPLSIEPERKKGEWEEGIYRSVDQTGETYRDGEAVICPFCRNAFKKAYVDPRWNYCPNCGADMRGEQE